MSSSNPLFEAAAKHLQLPLSAVQRWTLPEQEQIYANAYAAYENGRYQESADKFTHLLLNDPLKEKYWRGLASSRQLLNDYQAALHAWCFSALLKDEDPYPHFHAAECLLALHANEDAQKALQCAENRAKKGVQFTTLLSKISVLKSHLESMGTHVEH